MSNGDLSDQYIDDTFDGLLHVNGQPIPPVGLVKVLDGVGHESSISVGRSGNGVNINGSSSVTGSLGVSQNATISGQLIANNVSYPSSSNITSLFNIIYPIGSVYFSAKSISPASLFGGVWDQIAEGRFIVGAGTGTDRNDLDQKFNVGNDFRGEYKHTISTEELPSHSHNGYGVVVTSEGDTGLRSVPNPWKTLKDKTVLIHKSDGHNSYINNVKVPGTFDSELIIEDTGGDKSHNNIPPAFGLYVYTRIA